MIVLKRVSPDHPDFQFLIQLLDKDLWNRYPDTQQFFVGFNKIKQDAKAIVAYLDDQPAGCGCFRDAEGATAVEIKRMYVKEEARGRGIAQHILKGLEQWAREEGSRRAVLETGVHNPEAISLYKKLGYELIEKYEPYVNSKDSVCLGKDLEG